MLIFLRDTDGFIIKKIFNFFRIARGSLSETHNHLTDALDEKYITNEEFEIHVNQVKLCTRLLNGYINYLEKQKASK